MKMSRVLAYYFRWPGSGWVGLAVAPTMNDIFWAIDEFGNPYDAEIQKTDRGGFCVRQDGDEREFEYSDSTPLPDDDRGWVAFKWAVIR
jgi:hypothetical protein